MINREIKKVIITGATGFIGKNLVESFTPYNVEVYALVRNVEKAKCLLPADTKIILYNSYDYSSIYEIFSNINIDAFINLAWEGVNSENKNDIDMQISNINMTLKALQFAKSIDAKLFISAGTVAEYVFSKDVIDVYEKQTPNDMYGAAKVATHYFLDVFTRSLNMPFIWVILPSAYGEGRSDSNIITYTIKSLLNGEKPSFGNLTQMWDFLYVKEIARAIVLLCEHGIVNKVYGIGSGIYKPLREYIEIIRDTIDKNLPLGIGDRFDMSKQTFSSCVNIDELKKDTGFVPKILFSEGIKKTIDWYKNNGSITNEKN